MCARWSRWLPEVPAQKQTDGCTGCVYTRAVVATARASDSGIYAHPATSGTPRALQTSTHAGAHVADSDVTVRVGRRCLGKQQGEHASRERQSVPRAYQANERFHLGHLQSAQAYSALMSISVEKPWTRAAQRRTPDI